MKIRWTRNAGSSDWIARMRNPQGTVVGIVREHRDGGITLELGEESARQNLRCLKMSVEGGKREVEKRFG